MGRPRKEDANPQAKSMSGFSDITEVAAAAPETTQSNLPGIEAPQEERVRKPRKPRADATPPQPEMPPEVARFMREMLAEDIGGFGTVPYEVAAWYFNTPELGLSDKEKRHWSDGLATYAYLKGWDVKSPTFVLGALIAMQFGFAVKRAFIYCEKNGISVPELVQKWFAGQSDTPITPGPERPQ